MSWALQRGTPQGLANWRWRLEWRVWRRKVERLHADRRLRGEWRWLYG